MRKVVLLQVVVESRAGGPEVWYPCRGGDSRASHDHNVLGFPALHIIDDPIKAQLVENLKIILERIHDRAQ